MRLLCVLSLVIGVVAGTATVQAACPSNTFTCKDGSCIPEDWVGDGEPDCDDKSDELGQPVRNRTAKEEDPFDEIVTLPTHMQHSSKERHPGTDAPADDCPYEHQLRVDECAEPILLFLHEVNAIYFENSSLLSDKETQVKISKGCELMREYQICVQGASTSCNPDEGVQAWRQVEMYVCQLLIPTVREHQQCFGQRRDPRCSLKFDPLASPFCRLVTSVTQDVRCIQQFGKDCSEAALEMLQPIIDESEEITNSLRCRSPADVPPPTTEAPAFENDEDERAAVAPSARRISSDAVVTSSTTTRRTIGPVIQLTSITPDSTTAITVAPENAGRELKINMSDAVNSLYYIYDICSSDYSKSPYAAVAAKICLRQDEIAKQSDCYQNTLEKEKCATRDAKTECEALEAFNANLDCAIVTMNDHCEVDAQNTVIEIQEAINDIIIERKCFEAKEKAAAPVVKSDDPDEFHLETRMTHCTDDQENGALACLVELLEINKQLAQFQNLNFLLEIATDNSSVVANICELYGKYEKCLNVSVFKDQKRCAFASPLNTLARIGLAPICSIDSRPLLANHKDCLMKLATQASGSTTNCQSGLSGLGNTVGMMMQGIHGEALLCKSFYMIRDTFSCGEKAVEQQCDAQALRDLGILKRQMSELGEEEGCPRVPPANLDAIIARPVKRPTPMPRPSRPIVPPMARALNTATPLETTRGPTTQIVNETAESSPSMAAPMVPPPSPPQTQTTCTPPQQKKFEVCVRPLTTFQPHPLSVIKAPRQIDEACEEFKKFQTCVADVACHPLWAKGMTAMFSYACGEGSEGYKKVRQCLRKVVSGDTVKECVSTFSRGAPTQACLSANALLTCAIAPIQTECGEETSEWVLKYVTKFATAIDPRCKLASQLPIGKVIGVGCSGDEEAIIEHCAAPLNDIGSRLEELFQGGLQAMIKNVNSLAPVFAGGCNLTDEFRQCASFLFTGRTPCVVSSCLIRAGEGICNQPDPTKAIDDNLSCVFAQVQEPTFAKCVRSTLSTVKQFTLSSFRNILPKFVDCTEEIVLAKCGQTPINVLRAMSSPDICPVGPAPIVPVNRTQVPQRVEPQLPTCTPEKQVAYDQCTQPFYTRYRMLPITLINEMENMDQVCADVSIMDGCSISTRVCASAEQMALKKMIEQLCASREAYDHYKICLKSVASSQTGASCMSEFMSSTPGSRCSAIQNAAVCMAKQVRDACGDDALTYSFAAMNDYARLMDNRCRVDKPSVSIATGCSEQDMVAYLSCESSIDPFSFRPVSIIGDGTKWDEMCTAFASSYRPCVEKMSCKFEPVSSANIQLFDGICNRPITLRDQKSYGRCLSDYTNTPAGQKCIAAMASVDPMASDAASKMCQVLNSVLTCAGNDIEKECGYGALLHVYEQHTQWAQAYNKSCVVQSPEPKSVPTNTLDQSKDVEPQHVTRDELPPPSVVLQKDSTPIVINNADTTAASPEMTTTPSTENESAESATSHPKDISTTTVKGSTTSMLSVLLVFVITLRVF